MKLLHLLTLMSFLILPLVLGCGSGDSAPVADHNDIADYIAENPNADAGTEPEGGDL